MNTAWHKRHRMPPRATPAQRLDWHLAHAKACGCRELSTAMLRELRRRVADARSKRDRRKVRRPARARKR